MIFGAVFMVGDQSLQMIMNDVAAVVSAGDIFKSCKQTIGTLDEFGAFLMLDALLADLQKQYLDAKSNHAKAVKEYGPGEPMTDMAAWMEDSAWCAVQTRYMELRADRVLMAKAQTMVRADQAEGQDKEEKTQKAEALKIAQMMQLYESMRPQRKDNDAAMWWLYFLLFHKPQADFRFHHPAVAFNRLAA
jgi:hypothetical protein